MGRNDLMTVRKSLDEICEVPDKIISVYTLEQHVWADVKSPEVLKARKPELQTIREFQIDPVRPFLNEFFRGLAAPYRPERKDEHIGQGYWVQAEFGSGKSHLLCFLAALALGDQEAWEIVQSKEQEFGKGKRESLYRFWEDGLKAKSTGKNKGMFVIVKTLTGVGTGTIGHNDRGRRLTEYILDSAREQLFAETGKNVSLYPAELLADRFIKDDLSRFHEDLRKFLKDPRYFEPDEFEDVNTFINDIKENRQPDQKLNCGNKLWRFYDEYLRIRPNIEMETEEVLKYMVEAIMSEGYSGVLLLLDEVSQFMLPRLEEQRIDDEKTLVILSNRLSRVYNLPVWTVCTAQQALQSKLGERNIIADDRLKLVKLLEDEKGYYDIVLSRVRKIKDFDAITPYYIYYKRGFTWPLSIGEDEFKKFFPFHRPALEVLRAITFELTTARSAIHFMHQTLRHQVNNKGRELIRLWELFDETVTYTEDPSGTLSGLVQIKTQREREYLVYENSKNQIEGQTKGFLKVYHDKAIKTLQTLFLYYISKTKQQGITPEEIANSVMVERSDDATPDENNQHYMMMADNLKNTLQGQIVESKDEEGKSRYKFHPEAPSYDIKSIFNTARNEAVGNPKMRHEAWEHLLAFDKWIVRCRNLNYDLSHDIQSVFRKIAPFGPNGERRSAEADVSIFWLNREVIGSIGMKDLASIASDNRQLPQLATDQNDKDFAIYIGIQPVSDHAIEKILELSDDPRIFLWNPGVLTTEEQDLLLDFAAYRKIVSDWQGKDSDEAKTYLDWVYDQLGMQMARIEKIVDSSYSRGSIDALNNTKMDAHVAGELEAIVAPAVQRVLAATYESRDIKFDDPFRFTKDEGVKVINGIVKTGVIPRNARPDKNISAAQNFGFGLKIMKRGEEKQLDTTDNMHIRDMLSFIESKLPDDGEIMKIETIYKNFMGIGGPKDYGLTKRMVQVYLLCLVKEGHIRINLGAKSGLSTSYVDYSNIADIEFSAKVLDSFINVQKMTRPENWEVLRPYAEKLLDEVIPVSIDEAQLSIYRLKLRELFEFEREKSQRVIEKAKLLFSAIECTNPYEREIEQFEQLFKADLSSSDEIDQILYVMEVVFTYKAFKDCIAHSEEVDDLAARFTNYRDIKNFITYEDELKAAHAYINYDFSDIKDLAKSRQLQEELLQKINNINQFIDSEIKLKTEIVGENGILKTLINDYTMYYWVLHNHVSSIGDKAKGEIRQLLESRELRTLKALESIPAMNPPCSPVLEQELYKLIEGVFACPDPSRISVESDLKSRPEHKCGLSFINQGEHVESASLAVLKANQIFNESLDKKMEIFLNPTVKVNLSNGAKEEVIGKLLQCENVGEVRSCLVEACNTNPKTPAIVGKYMKKIAVKPVKLSDFRPSITTIEKQQVPDIVTEFKKFLEEGFNDMDSESLRIIKLD